MKFHFVKVPHYIVIALSKDGIHIVTDDEAYTFKGIKSFGVVRMPEGTCTSCKDLPAKRECDHAFFVREVREFLDYMEVHDGGQ